MQLVSDFAIKGRESALVIAGLLAIHPNVREVIRSANMEKRPRTWLALILEVFLVPEGSFIEEQRVALGVPVTRNLQRLGFREVVLDQPAAGIRLLIAEISISAGLHAEVVIAVVVGIDDHVPVAIEADRSPVVGVNQQSWLLVGSRQDFRTQSHGQ